MLLFFFFFFFIILILSMMLLLNMFFSKKLMKNREKMSPFECGFDCLSLNRVPFSLHFYLIAILFLIFDVEIVMVLPMINSMNFNYYLLFFNYLLIILLLIFGLLIEWKEGALKWFN